MKLREPGVGRDLSRDVQAMTGVASSGLHGNMITYFQYPACLKRFWLGDEQYQGYIKWYTYRGYRNSPTIIWRENERIKRAKVEMIAEHKEKGVTVSQVTSFRRNTPISRTLAIHHT